MEHGAVIFDNDESLALLAVVEKTSNGLDIIGYCRVDGLGSYHKLLYED